MTRKGLHICSDIHHIDGYIEHSDILFNLTFTHQEKHILMSLNPYLTQDDVKLGQTLIDDYISHIGMEGDKIYLHHWYIKVYKDGPYTYHIGKGVVTGHPRIANTVKMSTSNVRAIYTDLENEEVLLFTTNNVYHCPTNDCDMENKIYTQ